MLIKVGRVGKRDELLCPACKKKREALPYWKDPTWKRKYQRAWSDKHGKPPAKQ